MSFHLLTFRLYSVLLSLLTFASAFGAEFPNVGVELVFYPTQNDQPVPNSVAFTRTYNLNGPVNGGSLLPGMLLRPGPGYLYAAQPHAVYRYDTNSNALQTMDTSLLSPELSWPMGITYDSTLGRMVLVSLGGQGTLYNYVVPDPTNAPANGTWSFLGSMENKDVDSIAYHASDNTFYAVGFSFGAAMPARIHRIRPDGLILGEIPLPSMPFDINVSDYESELVSVGDYLVLFLEPRDSSANPIQESRIYLINPVTYEVHLTYQRELDDTTGDNTPPVVQIRTPEAGTNYLHGVPIFMAAHAVDAGGSILQLDFHRNGAVLAHGSIDPGQTNLYTFTWSNAPVGSHTLTALAKDAAGNIATSLPITITVTNAPGSTNEPPDTLPPVVELRSPLDGAKFNLNQTVNLKAHAVDVGGSIQLIEFLRDGTVFARGASTAAEPNLYAFNWTNAPLGTNRIAARAIDAAGNRATSAPVSIIIVSNALPQNLPPVVRLTTPVAGANYPLGPIQISARATDSDGEIAKVEFYVNAVSVAVLNPANPPSDDIYSYRFTPSSNGTYHVMVRTTDNDGGTDATRPIRITVGSPGETNNIWAHRTLPEEFRAGHPFQVEVEVKADPEITSWRLEEEPPAGWRVIGVTHGGRFDRNTGKVVWNISKHSSRTVRYHLISSRTNTGTFTFSGVVIANGESVPVGGDTETTATRSHKKVKIHKPKGGKVIVRFDPEDEPRWVVEYTDSMKHRVWTVLPKEFITVEKSGEISINDTDVNARHRFYRVRLIED